MDVPIAANILGTLGAVSISQSLTDKTVSLTMAGMLVYTSPSLTYTP